MRRYGRWMAALLAAATAVISVFPGLALPAAESFAEFHIGASSTDAPERTLSIARYTRGADGSFQLSGSEEQVCKLNRVTRDANFFIQPSEEGVWVTVDYLSDVNSDGVYELLDGGSRPAWEVMDVQSELAAPQGQVPTLAAGEMYILSSELLVQRSEQAAQERLSGGAHAPPKRSFPCALSPSGPPTDGTRSFTFKFMRMCWSLWTSPLRTPITTRWFSACSAVTSPAPAADGSALIRP